mmetsp:Transcript_33787/g.81906  ORF Transcript_33787/g.81906 Transcript_33787/m.81906 type:complete len:100 (-) Transcript_33787:131-430(-)
MSFYTTSTNPFASTAAPTFHGASTTTKRGCDSMNESYEPQEGRSNKRIKTSPQTPGFHGSALFQPQPSFQASPIQFTSPSGSNYFNFGSPAQAKKQFRA